MSGWRWFLLGYAVVFTLGPLLGRGLMTWRRTGHKPVLLESPETANGWVQLMLGLCLVGYGTTIGLQVFLPGVYTRIPAFAPLQLELIRWAGVVLCLLGLLVAWIAQGQMGRSWRFGLDREKPASLVTEGIYAHCRNPIYLCMMLAALGVFLLLPDAFTLVFMVLTLAMLGVLVRLEEQYLRDVHGPAFEAYCRKAGRFLPSLGSR